MIFPTDLFYSKEHTWVNIQNQIATIGITAFAQSELGEVVFVELPNTGDGFEKDEVFGSVEALKTVSDLFMPISGKVIETNNKLQQKPILVNNDSYGEGWMIKIEILKPEEIASLLSATDYQLLNGF